MRERDMSLHEINVSELDYAVVAYIVNCMPIGDRDMAIGSLRDLLKGLPNQWHATETDCITGWNRLLSRLQPYEHALAVALSGGGFLMEGKTYLPFTPTQMQYLRMKFRMQSE
jgi:hypothetical protein